MEFVVKAKTHNLIIGDQKYPFRSPKQYEIEKLNHDMALVRDSGKVDQVYNVWYEFFETLGLKREVVRELDPDTFSEFTMAVIAPKNE
jgi:hypothetical protein